MEIIVPAAGKSSRFPDMKPKYLLYDYKHQLMIQSALEYYRDHNITIGILKEHDEKYRASELLRYELNEQNNFNVKIVIIEAPTKGPADTVYQILQTSDIDDSQSMMIKDCDSFFEHDITDGNYVCVSNIKDHEIIKKIGAKSFIVTNEQGIITNIIEKSVVSDKFCVGGYKFQKVSDYKQAFQEIFFNTNKEIFVSDVIQRCLSNKLIFEEKSVKNYIDVGTADDWFTYNDKPVFFCDIDGTLIKNQGRIGDNNYLDEPIVLEKNVKLLLKKQHLGSQFVFTTSRPKKFEDVTRHMLDNLGFENYQLIIGLQNSKRILINDYNKTNPWPRAEAINLRRDIDELDDFL